MTARDAPSAPPDVASAAGALPRVPCPRRLEGVLRTFVADEGTSALRHDARNKLAALGNGIYFVRRKLGLKPDAPLDPKLAKALDMMDGELAGLAELLSASLPIPDAARVPPTDLAAVARGLADALAPIARIEVRAPDRTSAAIDRDEAELALFCLVENAIEATASGEAERSGDAGRIVVDVGAIDDDKAGVTVTDGGPGIRPEDETNLFRAGFTTKPGRSGTGLRMARRIAARWGGDVKIGSGPRGRTEARLVFRRSGSDGHG